MLAKMHNATPPELRNAHTNDFVWNTMAKKALGLMRPVKNDEGLNKSVSYSETDETLNLFQVSKGPGFNTFRC